MNATVKHWPTSDVTGRIILVRNADYPYDGLLRRLSPMRPAAVLFVQETVGYPGDGMYAVDGRERKSITIPVAETYASKKVNASTIPDGTFLEMYIEYNLYTDIKGSAYFPVMNSLVSIWEWGILILAGYHLYLFSRAQHTFSWLSIGPLCLVLEMIGLAIRFGTTILDPFYSNRLLPVQAMGILISVHMPFLISSGILLTFYCTFTHAVWQIGGTQSCQSIRFQLPLKLISCPRNFPNECLTLICTCILYHSRLITFRLRFRGFRLFWLATSIASLILSSRACSFSIPLALLRGSSGSSIPFYAVPLRMVPEKRRNRFWLSIRCAFSL